MENTELIIPAPSDPLKKHKSHFSKIGLFYFCGAIIISGVQISVITLIQLIAPQLMVNPNISLIISSLSMYLIAMPLLVIIVRTIPGMVIHKKKMTAGQWIIAFFMCYALMYVTNVIGTFTTAIFLLFSYRLPPFYFILSLHSAKSSKLYLPPPFSGANNFYLFIF